MTTLGSGLTRARQQGGRDGSRTWRGRSAKRFGAGLAAASLVVPLLPLMTAPAQAATAAMTQITGGYTAGDTTYAKEGTRLTISVTSSGNADRCVLFTDTTTNQVLGSVYNTNKAKTWTFTLAAVEGDGPRTVRATVYGQADNSLSGSGTTTSSVCRNSPGESATVSYVLDNTAPVVTGSVAPADRTTLQNGWYNGNVIVSWTCTDAGSDLWARGCPGSETVAGEGANLSRSVTVEDNLGNSSSSTVGSIKIDWTAPTTTVSPDLTGWQQKEATLTFSASDNLSGVATTEYRRPGEAWTAGKSITLGEGRHSIEYRSTDVAGNVEQAKSVSVDIDWTAPTITSSQDPAANEHGWNKSDVTVTFACQDGLSGVAHCASRQTVTAEGTTTVSGTAVDNAGNNASVEHQVNLDKTPPTITPRISGEEGNNGWYTGDVSVTFTCTDDRSGIVNCPAEQTLTQGAGQSVTGNTSDLAGNTASRTVEGINIDTTPPTTTSDAPSGWQNRDVTVEFTATDQDVLSGVDHSEYSTDAGHTWTKGSTVTLGEGTHTLLFLSVDKAGNREEPQTTMVQIDKTDPTIIGTPDRDAVDGWYNAPVTISFECSDEEDGSGIVDGTCPADVELREGDKQMVTRTVSDNAGNVGSVSVGPINVDLTAPTTSVSAPEGWQNDDVTVALTPTDNLSGIASTQYRLNGAGWVEGTSIPLSEGEHTIDFFSTDVAGNVEGVQTVSVKIDRTAPTIEASQAPKANAAGWNNTDVTVSFTCGDNLSGVASCTAPRTVGDEGTTVVDGNATDGAGHSNSASHTVMIDKTAPTITHTIDGTRGENGWYTSDVTVTFACADALSGVADCTPPQSFGEGAGRGADGTATDAAGNTASDTVTGINVDKTAPETTSNAPTGWQNHDVTVKFTATDKLSGVARTEWSTDGQNWTQDDSVTLGEGEHTLLFRSVDRAGNVEAEHSALVQVDKTAPSLSLTGPASTSDKTVTLNGTVSDSGSGVAIVTVGGEGVSVNTDGTFSATVDLSCGDNTVEAVATDAVGNSTTATHDVNRVCAAPVVWTATGFMKPVDMDKVNSAKGGSTVPLKFQVFKNGVEQTDVSVVTGMKVTAVNCKSGDEVSTVDQIATGGTSLRYTGGQFMQNWQTPKAAGCYIASVQVKDGVTISASFTLK